jgi:GT2 family glycosyltransferase
MIFAPIALFVYNRPAHTRQTVEALLKNELAGESDLFIFSDAPKAPEAAVAVSEVREYIRSISRFKSVSIIERDINFGLAHSIIDGVTRVVSKYGRIIVMEDDLVTSPYFLTFMNDALDVYRDEEKAMHISGYMFPVSDTGLPETFFLRPASCWGWGTWDRAWKCFSKEPRKLLDEFSVQAIHRFNLDGSYNYWSQVQQNVSGVINTWAVFWYASVFKKGGLCLHPKYSMVSNIGHDGTGIHCGQSDEYAVQLASKPITYFERNLVENTLALKRTKSYFLRGNPTFFSRLTQVLRRRFCCS